MLRSQRHVGALSTKGDWMMVSDDPAYQAGFMDMMRMHALAQQRGWRVPERVIAREMMRLEHAAAGPTGGRDVPLLGQRMHPPAWYRGRADALRQILHEMREQ